MRKILFALGCLTACADDPIEGAERGDLPPDTETSSDTGSDDDSEPNQDDTQGDTSGDGDGGGSGGGSGGSGTDGSSGGASGGQTSGGEDTDNTDDTEGGGTTSTGTNTDAETTGDASDTTTGGGTTGTEGTGETSDTTGTDPTTTGGGGTLYEVTVFNIFVQRRNSGRCFNDDDHFSSMFGCSDIELSYVGRVNGIEQYRSPITPTNPGALAQSTIIYPFEAELEPGDVLEIQVMDDDDICASWGTCGVAEVAPGEDIIRREFVLSTQDLDDGSVDDTWEETDMLGDTYDYRLVLKLEPI